MTVTKEQAREALDWFDPLDAKKGAPDHRHYATLRQFIEQSQGSGHAAAPTDELSNRFAALKMGSWTELENYGEKFMPTHIHEAWWLIESNYAPVPLYYAGHKKRRDGAMYMHMVDDAAKAVRFPDEWPAKYAAARLAGIDVSDLTWPLKLSSAGYKVTEHIFDYTPLAPPAAAPAVQIELTDFRSRLADKCARLAEWEPCDCGCEGSTPKSAKDVALVQAAAALRRSLLSGTRTCVQAGDSHTQEISHLAAPRGDVPTAFTDSTPSDGGQSNG